MHGNMSAGSKLQSSLLEFQWQLQLKQKLQHVLDRISRHFYLQNLCCVQVWLSATGCQQEQNLGQMQLYADPNLALLGDPAFADFRSSSCHNILAGRYGMPGRVWIGGCVQVVQNINIIPSCLHPRSKLSEELSEHVAEVVYITVYDPTRPKVGPVAVMEALFACKSTDSMMVANFISFVSSALLQMKLTLSDPAPKPFKCSKLAGRKPAIPSEADVASEQQQAQDKLKQQQQQPAAAAAAADVPADDEGCGDTHASDDDDGGSLHRPAMQEPGELASNRPIQQQRQQQQQGVLGKRKASSRGHHGEEVEEEEGAATAGCKLARVGSHGSTRGDEAPTKGHWDRCSPAPTALPAALRAIPAASGTNSEILEHHIAAAVAISTRSDATGAPIGVGAVVTSSAGTQGPMHAPRPVPVGHHQGSGGEGERPRRMALALTRTMTRTKSVPLDLCVMEVASTASSKPKDLHAEAGGAH